MDQISCDARANVGRICPSMTYEYFRSILHISSSFWSNRSTVALVQLQRISVISHIQEWQCNVNPIKADIDGLMEREQTPSL